MPRKKIAIRPGVNTQVTPSQNELGVSSSNLVRVQQGLFQRLGGWERLFDAQCNDYVRCMHAWKDLDLVDGLLIAGDGGAQLYAEGNLANFGLVRRASNVTPPWYSTVSGSSSITVTDTDHGVTAGERLTLNVPVSGPPDGLDWVQRTSGTIDTLVGATTFGGQLYAVEQGGDVYRYSTLDDWSVIGSISVGAGGISDIAASGSVLVAVGYSGSVGYIYSSTDGVTWVERLVVVSGRFERVSFGNSLFVAAGINGVIYTSSNGTTWTARTSGTSQTLRGSVWSGSVFCVVGDNGAITTSPTGVTWTVQVSGTGNDLYDVAWSGSVLCAVGEAGTILTAAAAGATWTPRTSGTVRTLTAVTFGGSSLYATGLVSSSLTPVVQGNAAGTTWNLRSLDQTESALDITYFNGRFLLFGNNGLIASTLALGANQSYRLAIGDYTVTNVINANSYVINGGALASSTFGNGGYPAYHTVNFRGAPNARTIRVYLNGHGMSVGQEYILGVTVRLPNNDITLSGSYTITNVASVNAFDFDCGETATTSIFEGAQSGGGQVALLYPTDAPTTAINWSLDNLGQNALLCPENGQIYVYEPPLPVTGTPTAIAIETGPQINTGMFVAMPQAQIIAFGSEETLGGGVQDPLLVRWSDVGIVDDWIATPENQAGSFRLSRGSRIVGGLQAPQASLLWTDTDCWSVQYVGPPAVYSFITVGTNCGLVAPKARTTQGRNTYWMSKKGFFQYGDSGMVPVPCSVWNEIFNDLDQDNIGKVHAGGNAAYNEVWFFYPSISGGTGEIDKYVKMNVAEGTWDFGSLCRTAWIDQNVFGNALGADENFRIQQHEIGYNADGEPMAGAFIQTGYAQLEDGTYSMFVDEFQPDFRWMGPGYEDGGGSVTVVTSTSPQGPQYSSGPYVFTPDRMKQSLRSRGRYMAVRIEWTARPDFNFSVGAPTFRLAPAGRQP